MLISELMSILPVSETLTIDCTLYFDWGHPLVVLGCRPEITAKRVTLFKIWRTFPIMPFPSLSTIVWHHKRGKTLYVSGISKVLSEKGHGLNLFCFNNLIDHTLCTDVKGFQDNFFCRIFSQTKIFYILKILWNLNILSI